MTNWIRLSDAVDLVAKQQQMTIDSARIAIREAVYNEKIYSRGYVDLPRANSPFLINPPAWHAMSIDYNSNLLEPGFSNPIKPASFGYDFFQFQGMDLIIKDVCLSRESLDAWADGGTVAPPALAPFPDKYRDKIFPAHWGDVLPDPAKRNTASQSEFIEHGAAQSDAISFPEPLDIRSEGTAPAEPQGAPRKKGKRGPAPGKIDKFRDLDEALIPRVDALIKGGSSSLHAACLELAKSKLIAGPGTDKSKADRLARRYRKNSEGT